MDTIFFSTILDIHGVTFGCPTCGVNKFHVGPQGGGDYNVRCINGHYGTTRLPFGVDQAREPHKYPEIFSEKVWTLQELW